jgi:hypothetical protein
MSGRKYKFPNTGDYPKKHPVVLCPADRVLNLFKQETGGSAKIIAKKVKEWFEKEALHKGWAGCKFVPEVQSVHGAGAILLNPLSTTITLNQIVIQLPQHS